jgi:REP element-mobilizing transposase RayT
MARPHKLAGADYRGGRVYAVTCCAYRRRRVLATPVVARIVITALERSAAACRFDVLAYCVMPDHVHVIAAGTTRMADFRKFMRTWRQQSGYSYAQASHERLWQPGYFDRALRRHDDLDRLARYVLDNPVRAGLVPVASSWPWAGGTWRARL